MINSGQSLFGERSTSVYDVLAHLEPGLMLDVGAASGGTTALMLRRSPQSRVIAFEPFPGNHPYFEKTIAGDSRVTLHKAAVGPDARKRRFFVASTLTGSEKGWEQMAGYSSGGFLLDDSGKFPDRSIDVDTVRVDDIAGDEHVRFMKIDVQGGELGVLRSAERAIASGRIDFMYLEFSGEKEVLENLLHHGMQIFDSEYVLAPREGKVDLSNWQSLRTLSLSNGRAAYRGWPLSIERSPLEYCQFFVAERKKIGVVQTDLVAVAPHFVETFRRAAASATR